MNHFQSEQMNWPDETLCRAAAQGDAAAEEALVLRYDWLVRSCARPLFLMGADQEDLIQEGMFGLLKAIRDFEPERGASFHTFAELCIRRRMISAVRAAAAGRHAALNTSVSLEDRVGESDSVDDGPEARLIGREEVQDRFRRLHRELTALERQVLPLYLQGLSYQEIAQKLSRSGKSIDNAVQRIRRKLSHIN